MLRQSDADSGRFMDMRNLPLPDAVPRSHIHPNGTARQNGGTPSPSTPALLSRFKRALEASQCESMRVVRGLRVEAGRGVSMRVDDMISMRVEAGRSVSMRAGGASSSPARLPRAMEGGWGYERRLGEQMIAGGGRQGAAGGGRRRPGGEAVRGGGMRARARPRRKGEEAQRRPAISASGSLKRTCVHASSSGTSSTGSVSPGTQCRCPRASMLPFHATQIRRARRSTAVKARSITLTNTPASPGPNPARRSVQPRRRSIHRSPPRQRPTQPPARRR